jgi:hypothetical protein
MSLQVDLILGAERRSASPLNAKSALRILYIVAPVVMVVVLALIVLGFLQTKWELAALEQRWENTKPKKAEADELRTQLRRNEEVLDEIRALRDSSLALHEELAGLLRIVPADAQLLALSLTHQPTLTAAGKPARQFSLAMEGRAVGARADRSVADLRQRLQEAALGTAPMQSVEVTRFGPDTSAGAEREDRAFRIDCAYVTRHGQ